MSEININEILKIYNDTSSSNSDINSDISSDEDKNDDCQEYYNNNNNNNIQLINELELEPELEYDLENKLNSNIQNNNYNKFDLDIFKNLDNICENYNEEINFIMKIYNNFEIMTIDELEEINTLPLWHKLIILSEEKLIEIRNNREIISSVKPYPFKHISNNKIYFYNYKTKFVDGIQINNCIILRKSFKLNKRQIFEILLRDLENGNLKINSK
jgi:hypothetical protein